MNKPAVSGKPKPVEEVAAAIADMTHDKQECAALGKINRTHTCSLYRDSAALIEADRKEAQREACAPLVEALRKMGHGADCTEDYMTMGACPGCAALAQAKERGWA